MHSKSDLVWKKLITFEILSVSMDLESRDSKEGITDKVQAMRDKAEDLLEKSEDVGDITRFVKEFRVDVERKITPYTEKKNKKRYTPKATQKDL